MFLIVGELSASCGEQGSRNELTSSIPKSDSFENGFGRMSFIPMLRSNQYDIRAATDESKDAP